MILYCLGKIEDGCQSPSEFKAFCSKGIANWLTIATEADQPNFVDTLLKRLNQTAPTALFSEAVIKLSFGVVDYLLAASNQGSCPGLLNKVVDNAGLGADDSRSALMIQKLVAIKTSTGSEAIDRHIDPRVIDKLIANDSEESIGALIECGLIDHQRIADADESSQLAKSIGKLAEKANFFVDHDAFPLEFSISNITNGKYTAADKAIAKALISTIKQAHAGLIISTEASEARVSITIDKSLNQVLPDDDMCGACPR